MIWVENPFQGFVVGWTWAQHQAAGYEGGTDYIFYPSDGDITAAADGTIRLLPGQNGFTPGSAISLVMADGRAINYREVARSLVKNGRTVKRGDSIGVANTSGRWPHIDATVDGVRVPFEPLVNIGTDPSGGGSTPVIDSESIMQIISVAATDTFDIICDNGFHYPITHAQASSMFAGGAFGGTSAVVTAAQRTSMLAVCDGLFAAWCGALPAGSGGGMTLAQYTASLPGLAAAADLPTTGQLGEALTSTVSLVDSHVDAQFAALTLKTS